jgi:hypothetical protein
MARIFSFPEGDLLDDTGLPVEKKDDVLEFVLNNPEQAATNLKDMTNQIQVMIDCLNKINAYSQINKTEHTGAVLEIIKKTFNS